MKIIVTGANGQLGQCFQQLSKKYNEFEFVFLSKENLDITHKESVKDFFIDNRCDVIINCAAYTAVDKAEQDKELALKVNSNGVLNLSLASQDIDAHLVQISTDYVYHNDLNRPLKENDILNPKTVYGKTKESGHSEIIANAQNFSIIRTSWLYSEYAHNFLKTMVALTRDRETLSVVYDQVGTPTYALDLADFILHIIREKLYLKYPKDIINFSNSGVASWYDFAQLINRMLNHNCQIKPILSKDFPTLAQRPHYSVFNLEKVIQSYHYTPAWWQLRVEQVLHTLSLKPHH